MGIRLLVNIRIFEYQLHLWHDSGVNLTIDDMTITNMSGVYIHHELCIDVSIPTARCPPKKAKISNQIKTY